MLLSLAGCATDRARIERAASIEADASVAQQAIESAKQVPEQPADCLKREHSGVQEGDRLDIALVKTDTALSRANARVARCAGWYKDLKASRAAP